MHQEMQQEEMQQLIQVVVEAVHIKAAEQEVVALEAQV